MKSAFALAALAISSSVAAVPSVNNPLPPIHVPVIRRSSPSSSISQKYGAAAQSLRRKYGLDTVHQRVRKRQGQNVDVNIINQNSDSSYAGIVDIGTPAQSLNILLDTGSADLWIAGSDCQFCPSKTTFNSRNSSSFQQSSRQVQLNYGSGRVTGSVASETVSLGGFTVAQQQFLVVNQIASQLLSGDVFGILGLGFGTIAATGAKPFWQALVENNLFSSPEMSFYFSRVVNDTNASDREYGGVFTLGGTNSSLYQGNIEFIDFPSGTRESYWLREVSAVTVQGNNVNIVTGSRARAAIDTGTSLIGGPSADVAAIWAQVPGATATNETGLEGYYTFPCNTKVNVSFAFGGKSWPISPLDMNRGQISEGGPCLGAIFDLTLGSSVVPSSSVPSWVVGDAFLKNVYSVFRYSPAAVGFAQLVNDASLPSSGAPGVQTSRSVVITATSTRSNASPTGAVSNSASSGYLPPPLISAFTLMFCTLLV